MAISGKSVEAAKRENKPNPLPPAATIAQPDGAPLAKASLAAGILAVAGFIGLGFTAGGWWFLVGVVAVIAGVTARRRQLDQRDRRMALAGMILGGLIVLWFVGFMVISGIASLF